MTRISACVIVRDEEKNLPQWLRCVKGIADEIVVVDTGSRDNTVEIARQGGARVEHFAWCDDFGAAKNYALDCCRGTWVIMLDADEYFTEKDFPKVRGLIEAHEKELEVLGFLFQRINIDQDNQGAYLDSGPQIRVFRNLPELRYHGRIHENLRYEGQGKGTMVFFPDAVIYHTGYSSSLRREKNQRGEGKGWSSTWPIATTALGIMRRPPSMRSGAFEKGWPWPLGMIAVPTRSGLRA